MNHYFKSMQPNISNKARIETVSLCVWVCVRVCVDTTHIVS